MSSITLALLIFGMMLALMALRTPIAVSMFVAGSIGYIFQTGWHPLTEFLNTQAFARFASYDLSVIPLFILMGHFATQGGISKALFNFAAALMGRFKGGLAMASVLASAAFGAICGSSVATAATITNVALPEMKRHGYSGRLSTGTLAAGGTLGILIPPSVPLVIYAILTEQNIAKLFAAAMVPGFCYAGVHDSDCYLCTRRTRPSTRKRRKRSIKSEALTWRFANCWDLHTCLWWHLRRILYPNRRRCGWRCLNLLGGTGKTRNKLDQAQTVFLFDSREFSHDFYDLYWRRCHELLAGAHPSTQSVSHSGGGLGACAANGR
jgi:hypothetical protein